MTLGVAFVFPGQGRLPEDLSAVRDLMERLLDPVRDVGLPLTQWVKPGREDRLVKTDAAQPVLFLDSLCYSTRLHTAGWTPDWVAGHSLGEYAALVEAGVLDASAALRVVLARGRLMNTIEGSMAAILKLDWETVCSLCEGVDAVPANHNTPRQVVVSGSNVAVQQVISRAEQLGGRGVPLAVSGPFHSPYMRSAEDDLAPVLSRLNYTAPSIGFISSADGEAVSSPTEIHRRLLHQMTSPVRWVDVLDRLVHCGVTTAIEVGSGGVLTEMGKRSGTPIRFLTSEEALHETV